ncbi:MAG: hypothetical protein AB7V23_10400 [Candidatus Nanopelagicales bacterium]
MTALPDRWVPPSMVLPPIDHLPPYPADGVLGEFVRRGTRSWAGEPVPLPGGATALLWFLLLANVALTSWYFAWGATCASAPCWLVLLGGRPDLLLGLSLGTVLVLLGLVPLTRGLTRAGGVSMALLAVGAITGLVALLGVVALLVLGAAALVVVVLVAALVADS